MLHDSLGHVDIDPFQFLLLTRALQLFCMPLQHQLCIDGLLGEVQGWMGLQED